MKLRYFLPNELLLSLIELLNNEPKNPPRWIILEIWTSESFISVDILLSNAFLNVFLYLVVSNSSWGKLFPSNLLKLILKVVAALFLTAAFRFFSSIPDDLTFTLLYSTVHTIYRTFAVPL